MTTNVNIHSVPGKALQGGVHTFVNRCLQQCRLMARICSRFVTASGVVGFSGVKDSRKSVHIADASASAGTKSKKSQSEGRTDAEDRQDEGKTNTKLIQNECRHDANLMRQRCKSSMPVSRSEILRGNASGQNQSGQVAGAYAPNRSQGQGRRSPYRHHCRAERTGI